MNNQQDQSNTIPIKNKSPIKDSSLKINDQLNHVFKVQKPIFEEEKLEVHPNKNNIKPLNKKIDEMA